jgi:pimeloyl-ACP methyl ester carboxylesterase
MLPEKMQTANREIFAAPQEVLNLSHKLPLIRCPVVIVHGLDDSLVPYANALYLQKQLTGPPPDAVKLIAPKADHFLPWTHEPLIREAIESLLER